MDNDYIEMRENTPIPKTKICKIASYMVYLCLKFSNIIFTTLGWYIYDYFIAIIIFILGFIVVGIVRSKLRNNSIPINQLEYHYDDYEISKWYVDRYIC